VERGHARTVVTRFVRPGHGAAVGVPGGALGVRHRSGRADVRWKRSSLRLRANTPISIGRLLAAGQEVLHACHGEEGEHDRDPTVAHSLDRSQVSRLACGSKLVVSSSSTATPGLPTSASATDRRCFCPPDSLPLSDDQCAIHPASRHTPDRRLLAALDSA
jgi:hypothetical protein